MAATAPSQGHEAGPLTYVRMPAQGGEHNGVWSTCTGNVFAEQVSDENATRTMEHRAVWVAYRPDLPADAVARCATTSTGLITGS